MQNHAVRTPGMSRTPIRPTTVSAIALAMAVSAGALCVCIAPAGAATSARLGTQDGAAVNGTSLNGTSLNGTSLKIVTASAPLRCGDQDVFYAVGQLDPDIPLWAAGTSGTYTKVVLPASVGAFVPVGELSAQSAQSVTLGVDSKLRAPSQLSGISGSWKALYNTALPAGTTLKVIEPLKNNAGAVTGYRVVAPTSPSGEVPIAYIRSDALRDATQAETDAFASAGGGPGSLPGLNTAPPASPARATPRNQPPAEGETGDRPKASDDESGAPNVDTSMMDDMDLPGDGTMDETDAPVEIQNSTPTTTQSPTRAPDPEQRTAASGRLTASALEDLEAAFADARSLPKADLDEALGELLAEFSRTRAEAEPGSSLARALDQRIEWIKIRIASRDQRRAIAAALAAYDSRADKLAQDIEAWQQGRAYTIVGRMVPSAVYTGEHLPLLYRVQGIDPVTGADRTIGYVAPRPDQDFRHLLGRVVGVVGSRQDDRSLNLTVVDPDRIDAMPQ